MKQYFLLVLTIFFSPIFLFSQQNGGLFKGHILTKDARPVSDVNVTISELNRNVATDDNGNFIFSNMPIGTYMLKILLSGYAPIEKAITIDSGVDKVDTFRIGLSYEQVQEVIVNTHGNKFSKRESAYVARLPLKNLENPQVYNTVSKELLKEQTAIDMIQAQSNIPGVLVIQAGGGSTGITTRGFTSYYALRDGLNASSIGPEDPVNIEKIEAIKGPVGTLVGNLSASLGGVLNYVTKKPYEEYGGEVSYTAGTYQLNRLTADINAPLNKDRTLLFRVTGAYQTRNGYANDGGALWSNSYSINPKLTYKVNSKLTLNLESEMVTQKYNSVFGYSIGTGVTVRGFKDLPLAYNKSLSSNGLANYNFMNNVIAKADYKLSDHWISQTNYMYSEGHYPNQYLYATAYWLTDSTVRRLINKWVPDNKFGQVQFQQNFVGDFQIGNLRNRLVVGFDWSQYYYNLNRPTSYTVGYIDTVNVTGPIPEISQSAIESANADIKYNYTRFNTNMYSIYASDVLNITDNLLVMLSLRASRYIGGGNYSQATGLTTGKYNQTQYSPKLGIVYQLIQDKISLFANYNNGFVNVAPAATAPSGEVKAFKPQQANQAEGGVKFNLFNGRLTSTLSYYNIRVTNVTYADPTNAAYTVQDGTQRSRGFEVDIIANPITGLNVVAGYGYNENKYIKSSSSLVGKNAIYAPHNTANFWLSYKISHGYLQGLGIGAGGNYVGDSWFNATNTFILNGYTIVNAALFYIFPKFDLNFKLNNINNAHYWQVTGAQQMPRNVALSLAYKF